jgi:glycerophosphoryl diester phosphodiesterase
VPEGDAIHRAADRIPTAPPPRRTLRRVGHKGADHISPGNTAASFDAALEAGVDMIEFDVLPERPDGSGRLVLAHDHTAARRGTPPTLEEGLDHLAGSGFAGVELDVDLKLPGYELRVLEALRERGLGSRALVSSMYRESLAILRAAEPDLRLGWSVPRVQRDYTTDLFTALPALALLAGYRRLLPLAAGRALRVGECDAIMAHWRLVTPTLLRTVMRAGGELYVWTVDDAQRIAALEHLGVTGVISNDPRLFGSAPGSLALSES